jgi:hypothetical protein
MHADSPSSPRTGATYHAAPAHAGGAAPITQGGSMAGQSAAWDATPVQTMGLHQTGPRPSVDGTAFVTGAYQASGDPMIDRMLRLEHALKRYGVVR